MVIKSWESQILLLAYQSMLSQITNRIGQQVNRIRTRTARQVPIRKQTRPLPYSLRIAFIFCRMVSSYQCLFSTHYRCQLLYISRSIWCSQIMAWGRDCSALNFSSIRQSKPKAWLHKHTFLSHGIWVLKQLLLKTWPHKPPILMRLEYR